MYLLRQLGMRGVEMKRFKCKECGYIHIGEEHRMRVQYVPMTRVYL